MTAVGFEVLAGAPLTVPAVRYGEVVAERALVDPPLSGSGSWRRCQNAHRAVLPPLNLFRPIELDEALGRMVTLRVAARPGQGRQRPWYRILSGPGLNLLDV